MMLLDKVNYGLKVGRLNQKYLGYQILPGKHFMVNSYNYFQTRASFSLSVKKNGLIPLGLGPLVAPSEGV